MSSINKPVEKKMPRTPVQTRGIMTREKILNAGEELFARDGFHHILADDIAYEAGVSVGSFYSYFKNKRDVFLAVIDRCSANMLERITEQLAVLTSSEATNMEDLLQQVIALLIDAHLTLSPLYEQAKQIASFDEEIRTYLVDSDRSTLQLFEGLLLQFNPKLEKTRLSSIAFVMFHAVEGVVHSMVSYKDDEINMNKVRAELIRLVTSYLHALS